MYLGNLPPTVSTPANTAPTFNQSTDFTYIIDPVTDAKVKAMVPYIVVFGTVLNLILTHRKRSR